MIILPKFTGVLLVLGFASASPVQLEKKSVTVNQVLAPRIISKDILPHRGIQSYAKALAKYGAKSGAAQERVAHLTALAKKFGRGGSDQELRDSRVSGRTTRRGIPSAISSHGEQAGVVPANKPTTQVAGPILTLPNEYDAQYVSQIQIGQQLFWIDFDTGSSDLWVFGPKVTGLAPNQTMWHNSSTSAIMGNESFYISYGDGSIASGAVYTDQVYLGSVRIPKAAVEIADYADGTFDAPSSGIMGLGFDNLNSVYPTPQKTIFTTLIEQSLIARPILSTDLKHNAAGCYTFGDSPWWQYSGNIQYTSVDPSDGYWMFQPLGFSLNGTSSTANTSSAALPLLLGVADTGTTLILVQDELAAHYWSQIPSAVLDYSNSGGYIFDCDADLPDFHLIVGSGNASSSSSSSASSTYTIKIPGAFMNYAPLAGKTCFAAMQPTFGAIPFNIYGDVVLKSAFAVFDRGDGMGQGPRMGWADKGSY